MPTVLTFAQLHLPERWPIHGLRLVMEIWRLLRIFLIFAKRAVLSIEKKFGKTVLMLRLVAATDLPLRVSVGWIRVWEPFTIFWVRMECWTTPSLLSWLIMVTQKAHYTSGAFELWCMCATRTETSRHQPLLTNPSRTLILFRRFSILLMLKVGVFFFCVFLFLLLSWHHRPHTKERLRPTVWAGKILLRETLRRWNEKRLRLSSIMMSVC